TLSGGNPSATVEGTSSASASSGVVSFSGLHVRKTGTVYLLHASDNDRSLTAATSSSFDITPGVLSRFAWSSIASPRVAGVQFSPSVTAYDPYDNVKTDYLGAASLSSDMNGTTKGCPGSSDPCTPETAFHNLTHFAAGVAAVDATGYTA